MKGGRRILYRNYISAFGLSLSMFILGRTSGFQNSVFTWETIHHSPKTIGPDFYVPRFAYLLERKRLRSSSTRVVLPENENPVGSRRLPFQY